MSAAAPPQGNERRRETGPRLGARASPLLRAKLRAPAKPAHFVHRPRLHQLLDESVVTGPLTLVVAPAGAGKTALLAGWTAESEIATAWLSLDEADRDMRQLWSGLVAAVETLAPGAGAHAGALLERPGSTSRVAVQLLDDLEACTASSSVLVIDDLHDVDDDKAVAASLAMFVQHLPPWLHVVMLSRRDPHLPLDRLRARGQLSEVRFPELRFSHAEACDLLLRLAPSLTAEQIDAAAAHASGWAAGLQLAALSARSIRAQQGVERQGGERDGLVEDYVWHEVLGAEEAALVEVIVDTAVVDRVNASLAVALTGRPDAGQMLARAEARGLFVNRLGAEGWFEVHSLVRVALLAELASRSPRRVAELHARAAAWLEDAGDIPSALEHLILAERPRDALRLLAAKHATLYDSGREAAIRRTIDAIPPQITTGDVESMVETAWCHLLVSQQRFVELVRNAAWWADHATVDSVIKSRVTMLQSIAATTTGDWAGGALLARRVLHDRPDSWWDDPLGRFAWNMVAREIALSERWDDRGEDVREAESALCADPERRLALEGTQALGLALAGRPDDALRVAAGVRDCATVANMTILRTELALAEAVAHREIGDRSRAVPELLALHDAATPPMGFASLLATVELVDAYLSVGDLDAAETTFHKAEVLVDGQVPGSGAHTWLARAGTRLALAVGQLDEARGQAAKVADPFWGGIETARVHLAAGDRGPALHELEASEPTCVRHEVVLELLRSRALDQHEEAVKHATAAVELAAAHGMLQTVATEAAGALQLIEAAAWRVPQEWMDRLRRAAITSSTQALAIGPEPSDTLTERERDVLRFLPSRLTLAEIANELYVSVNTLKFHLKLIYRKLGVSSRAEAAEVARRRTAVRRVGDATEHPVRRG